MSATTCPLTRGGAALADAVRQWYREGQTDYSLEPIVLTDSEGKPVGRIGDGDFDCHQFCQRRCDRSHFKSRCQNQMR